MSRLGRLTTAQRDVVTALANSLCVTSGAGCGKTRVLVERYIHFLEQDLALPLHRLAAITFTENAAAEMRGRIRQACRDQVTQAREAGDRARMDLWLARYYDVDIAPIDTIHGFCGSLLRRCPIEAGVDPSFSLLDETEAALLLDDVAAATVEELLGRSDADLLAVLEHFGLVEARDLLAEMVGEKREVLQRVAAPVMARSAEEVLRELADAVGEETFRTLRDLAASPEFDEAVQTLRRHSGRAPDKREPLRAEALRHVERILSARTHGVARDAAEAAAALTLRGGSERNWPSKEAFDAVGDALKTIRDGVRKALESVPPFDEETERRHLALARALYRTAGRAVAAYEAAKRERSALDFEDLQIRARDLLRRDERVLEECRRRFRAILVDELQDTNLLQFEIVDLLASGAGGRGRPAALRPGALFGVGDPKQSIYRFRGAEVEVFERALARVTPAGQKSLAESFRLHRGTAALINHLFARLMGDRYEAIEGQDRQTNLAAAELLHVVDPTGDGFHADEGCAEEAARLAARVHEIVAKKAVTVWDEEAKAARPVRYGDIAVLFRRMTNLAAYEEALERRGVPYYVVAGSGFYKQQEVLDVLHLLRVLDDPADDLHLAGVLRSPFFAVSDEGLYHVRRLGPSLGAAVGAATEAEALAPEDRRGLRRAAALLPEWTAAKDRLGLAALLERVVFASGYAAASVGRFGGARAYANLRQMVELARRFERHGLYALGDYIDYVTDFMQSEMREEQAPIEAPGGDTVRLMTIHKAKGLEFPVVVVPDLAYGPRGGGPAYFVHPATGLAVRLRDEQGDRAATCAMALARRDDARAQRQESHRLLYVAMTRAKDYLIGVSHHRYHSAGSESWLKDLVEGLGIDLSAGDREVCLPGGPVVAVHLHPPQGEKAAHGRRRVGPRDVFAAGRVLWDRLHDRAGAARRGVAKRALDQVAGAAAARAPARVTATALAVYARCPRLYWWTQRLGVDEPQAPRPQGGLSAREFGILSHRAMELAASPDAQAVRAAVDGALREAPVGPGEQREELRGRLAALLEQFWRSPLGRRVAGARQAWREVPILLAMDTSEVSGTIDLLFEGNDGAWELVDYKSSSPAPGQAEEAARGYALQLGLYALAAGRWLGRPPARWTVYFLGSGTAVEHNLGQTDPARIEAEAKETLAGVAAARYDRKRGKACEHCRFMSLCGDGSA